MSKKYNISNISTDTGKGQPVVLEKDEILARKHFLTGATIGISISESENLEELGYGLAHIKDALIEITRYVVASGAKVAYGGDMRQGGFTELIFELLAYYKGDDKRIPSERFDSYLAYPISAKLTKDKEAELRQNVTFKKISPPDDLNVKDLSKYLNPDSTENLYIWTRCLTEMREKMESACNARILLGGRTSGFKGKYPGILEELLISLQHKHPVYLVGAFGGVTRDVIELFNNGAPRSMTNAFHISDPNYAELYATYNQRHPENLIDYTLISAKLQQTGFDGISKINGLSKKDNIRLSVTPHISEIVYLILKGLTNCFTS